MNKRLTKEQRNQRNQEMLVDHFCHGQPLKALSKKHGIGIQAVKKSFSRTFRGVLWSEYRFNTRLHGEPLLDQFIAGRTRLGGGYHYHYSELQANANVVREIVELFLQLSTQYLHAPQKWWFESHIGEKSELSDFVKTNDIMHVNSFFNFVFDGGEIEPELLNDALLRLNYKVGDDRHFRADRSLLWEALSEISELNTGKPVTVSYIEAIYAVLDYCFEQDITITFGNFEILSKDNGNQYYETLREQALLGLMHPSDQHYEVKEINSQIKKVKKGAMKLLVIFSRAKPRTSIESQIANAQDLLERHGYSVNKAV